MPPTIHSWDIPESAKDRRSDFKFCLRILDIDCYLAPPSIQFDPLEVPYQKKFFPVSSSASISSSSASRVRPSLVPIVRVWGTTPMGQKACVHVHGYFPYFFIPLPAELQETEPGAPVTEFLRTLGDDLENALSHYQSLNRRAYAQQEQKEQKEQGQHDQHRPAEQRRRFIFDLNIVSARAFYGFHHNPGKFVKITLFDPCHVQLSAALLQQGACCGGLIFQPLEVCGS